METRKIIETHTGDLEFGFFDGDEFISLDNDTIKECAEKFGCKEEFLKALIFFVSCLKDYVKKDLGEIWERLDGLEK